MFDFKKLEKSRKIWAGTIGGVLAAAFILWLFALERGTETIDTGSFVIASVNRQPIYLSEYRQVYNAISERHRDTLRDADSESTRRLHQQIQQAALNQLIYETIMIQQAKKNNIGVSKDQIFHSIVRRREFVTDKGYFDHQRYQQLPSHYHQFLEKETEKDLRSELLRYRIEDVAKLTELELKMNYEILNEKVKVQYVYLKILQRDDMVQAETERQQLNLRADKFLNLLKSGVNFNSAALSLGIPVKKTTFFNFIGEIKNSRNTNERLLEVENLIEFRAKAFALKPVEISEKISVPDGFIIIQALSRKYPNWNNYIKERSQLFEQLLAQKQANTFWEWYVAIARKAKIKENLSKLQEQQAETPPGEPE